MDFDLTSQQQRLRATARDFAYGELRPAARMLDRAPDPEGVLALVGRASELGLRTLTIPREDGGEGADILTEALVMEEIAAGDCGFAMTLGHAWREGRLLANWTTPGQRDRFLPGFLSDPGYLTALAMTEEHSGSDNGLPYAPDPVSLPPGVPAPGPQTVATRKSDGCWTISGTKRFITNGNIARLIVVWARTDPDRPWTEGVSGFLVPGIPEGTPGLTSSEPLGKLGLRLNQNTDLTFDRVEVPHENLLGAVNRGYQLSETAMLGSKVREAVRALGVARAAFELASEWARRRVQGGNTLVGHDTIAVRLGEVLQEIELARTMIWRAAWACDHDTSRARPLEDCAMLYASEMGVRAVAQCQRIFGARGALVDWPIEKLVRDAATIMLPPIGNEAAWMRLARYVRKEGELTALCPLRRDQITLRSLCNHVSWRAEGGVIA
jgi:alkylation response protein AidB-like acyl-CoA dehydrogenase